MGAGPAAAIHPTYFTRQQGLLEGLDRADFAEKSGFADFLDSSDCRTDDFSREGGELSHRNPCVLPNTGKHKESSEMKRVIFLLAAVGLASALTGCCWPNCHDTAGLLPGSCEAAPENCAACNAGCGSACAGPCETFDDPEAPCPPSCRPCRPAAAPGPPTAAVTYPYYTVRGPRDFLARNPRSIGP